jgi:hypothetical protein
MGREGAVTDPLEELLLEMPPLDEPALEELRRLLVAAEPYPWRVERDDSESEFVVVTSNGDAIASLPADRYGEAHAKLMAAAPLLALRILNAMTRSQR